MKIRNIIIDTIVTVLILISAVCLNIWAFEECWNYDQEGFVLGMLFGTLAFVINWIAKIIRRNAQV